MSKISRILSRLAAAQRVSMEDTNETVQGQDGELNEQELAEVAKKAEAKVDTSDSEAAGESAEVLPDAPAIGDDAGAEATDVPAADAGETPVDGDAAETPVDGDAATDLELPEIGGDEAGTEGADTGEAADAGEIAADAGEAGETAESEATGEEAGELPVEDIQTPAEAELAEVSGDATPPEGDLPPIGEGDAVVDVAAGETSVEVTDDSSLEVTEALDAVQTDEAGVVEGETAVELEVPAGDTAAEVTDVPAAAEASEQEAAPATAPGPKTDASEAVQEVVELTEAIAEAGSAEEVVKQARDMSDDLTEVADTAEVINETGGASMESLAMMQLALRPHLNALQRNELNLGVSLESFAGKPRASRMQVSIEEIRDVIAELEVAQPQLERQAIESLDRVVTALNDALPSACDRLKAVISNASASNDDREGGNVQIDDGLSTALQVDGAMPEDLANELQHYATFGKCLLGNYSDNAFRSAKAASLLTNAVDFTSVSAFWEKIGAVVDSATDPRCTLTRTQLEGCLPGGVVLFSEAGPELDVNNVVIKKLMEFNGCYAPLEAMVSNKSDVGVSTYPAMSASKIVLVGKALLDVLCCESIAERLSEGQKLWPEAQDSIRHLRENLAQAPREIEFDNGVDFTQIVKFVETHYALATWPLVNYLTNLVLTVNAFVLFAERSLKADEAADESAVAVDDVDPLAVPQDDNEELEISAEGIDAGLLNAGKLQMAYAQIAELKTKIGKLEKQLREAKGKKVSTESIEEELGQLNTSLESLVLQVTCEGFNDNFKKGDGMFAGATIGGLSTGLASLGFTTGAILAILGGGPAFVAMLALGSLAIPSVVGAYIGHRKQELENELKMAKEKLTIKKDGLRQLKIQATALGVDNISLESLNVSMEGATGILKGLLGGATGPVYGAYAGHGIEKILQDLDGVGLQVKAVEEETEALLKQITQIAKKKQK